jgi:predicted enzyme related to lactoylglutathione lyase
MENKFLGLRTAIYKVADLHTAKEWYTNVFQTEPYYDESYYVGFNIGGFELGLLPDSTSAQNKTEGVVAYWGVENIESKYNRIIGSGAVGHEPPKNVGGEIVVATVKDPWGNMIGLIYNPEFKIGTE